MDREARGVAPLVEVDPLHSLPIHRLKTWSGLGVGRRPIQSFQMTERLLDIPPSKFVKNHLTNLLRPCIPVRAEQFLHFPLHRASFVAAELPSLAE